MLTIEIKECNCHLQNIYDAVLNDLQFQRIRCPVCGHAGHWAIHGYYKRTVKSFEGTGRLRICRLRCTLCKSTHAILPDSLVPYSQISTETQVLIAQAVDSQRNPESLITPESEVDENNVKSVVRRYRRYWRERLRSERILLEDISLLIRSCFSCFSEQFMQIRRTTNCLIPDTT